MDISQYFLINALDTGASVVVRRGNGAPTITGGGARWNVVNRPKRTSITLFDGSDPYKMDVPLLFDGWGDPRTSVEADIAKLNQMRFSLADRTRPTRIRITGAMPVKGATWIIDDLSWGTNVIWDVVGNSGFRFRQDVVMHITQFMPEQALAGIKQFVVNDKVIKLGAHQTVKDVAKGDAAKAKAIQKANAIRDAKNVKAGQTMRIPFR